VFSIILDLLLLLTPVFRFEESYRINVTETINDRILSCTLYLSNSVTFQEGYKLYDRPSLGSYLLLVQQGQNCTGK
jgi:hypothetical protein